MTTDETRVASVAEAILAARHFVTPVDVLLGLEWVSKPSVASWLRGITPFLDRLIFSRHGKVNQTAIVAVLDELAAWAHERSLQPWETDYGDRTFVEGGDPAVERSFRTRWAVAEKPAPRIPLRARVNARSLPLKPLGSVARAVTPADSSSRPNPVVSAWTVPASAIWSSCPPAMPH